MNRGKLALRLIIAAGLATFWVADWIGDRQPAPTWFASGVSEAALMLAISTTMLWIGLEVVLHFARSRGSRITVLAVAFMAVAYPALCLVNAAAFGMTRAEFNTWHLLALFAPVHQIYAIIATLMVAMVVALLVWIVRSALTPALARFRPR